MPKYTPRSKTQKKRKVVAESGSTAVLRGRFRYSLSRWWEAPDATNRQLTWIMLNPSTADAALDDPTIRRVVGFTRAYGYPRAEVVNLFAYRTASPAHLWGRVCDIRGAENRSYLRAAVLRGSRVVVAWGAARDPRLDQAVEDLRSIFASAPQRCRPVCLGMNQDGSPKHPLYLRGETKLEPWGGISSPRPLFEHYGASPL